MLSSAAQEGNKRSEDEHLAEAGGEGDGLLGGGELGGVRVPGGFRHGTGHEGVAMPEAGEPWGGGDGGGSAVGWEGKVEERTRIREASTRRVSSECGSEERVRKAHPHSHVLRDGTAQPAGSPAEITATLQKSSKKSTGLLICYHSPTSKSLYNCTDRCCL